MPHPRTAYDQLELVAAHVAELGLRSGDSCKGIAPSPLQGERSREPGSRKPVVLVAEDNPANRAFIEAVLTALGVDAVAVSNGAAAVGVATTRRFDAVLMDCYMPELDGPEATMLIRRHEKTQRLAPVPVIALTAAAMPNDRTRCVEAGMNEFLAKPFNIDYLQLLLRRVLPQFEVNFR
ncbi:hypothetical protein BH09PSE5_BH09PSE5_11190 [soil metagenome]